MPEFYDCCPNSCCCYTGAYEKLKDCPYCREKCYRADGKPRKQFMYMPLIPHLVTFASNPDMAKQMHYRSEHEHTPGIVTDIFDGSQYRNLCMRKIHINGTAFARRYFEDLRDIALSLSTDGFAPHKHHKSTAWPLILFNYNLPPDVCFHLDNILSLGVIPGPKKPADIDSFLWPLIQELLKLSEGVRAFDALEPDVDRAIFSLCAFLIVVFGDILAVSMLMHMKGHNGISLCHMCKIVGLRIPNSNATTHYVPHDRSHHPDVLCKSDAIKVYDLGDLLLCSHDELMDQADRVQLASTNAEAENLAKEYGIKSLPLLAFLNSLLFLISIPYNFMHLIWENLIKNLILLWTREFKGLDKGTSCYILDKSVWEVIGKVTAMSGSTIPSAYGPRVPNVSMDRSNMSAEMWSFWTLYLGPVLLQQRFKDVKYFKHFVRLVTLLNLCLQFEISTAEIRLVQEGFISWVKDYEWYVISVWYSFTE